MKQNDIMTSDHLATSQSAMLTLRCHFKWFQDCSGGFFPLEVTVNGFSRYYRPQTKLREDYVFTGVCDSVHRRYNPSMHCRSPSQGWKLRVLAWGISRPTPSGEAEGSSQGGLQAHTQGAS